MDERKEIFTDEYSETAYSDVGDVYGEPTRYIREDLCIEINEENVALKRLPLFNCYVDTDGTVWVKIPLQAPAREVAQGYK